MSLEKSGLGFHGGSPPFTALQASSSFSSGRPDLALALRVGLGVRLEESGTPDTGSSHSQAFCERWKQGRRPERSPMSTPNRGLLPTTGGEAETLAQD